MYVTEINEDIYTKGMSLQKNEINWALGHPCAHIG